MFEWVLTLGSRALLPVSSGCVPTDHLGADSDDRMRFWIDRQYEEGSDGRP